MNHSIWKRILTSVEAAGWIRKNDELYGPYGTMYLGQEPWPDTLSGFLERMEGRRDRIKRNHDAWQGEERELAAEALSDVTTLVDVLRDLSDSAGRE